MRQRLLPQNDGGCGVPKAVRGLGPKQPTPPRSQSNCDPRPKAAEAPVVTKRWWPLIKRSRGHGCCKRGGSLTSCTWQGPQLKERWPRRTQSGGEPCPKGAEAYVAARRRRQQQQSGGGTGVPKVAEALAPKTGRPRCPQSPCPKVAQAPALCIAPKQPWPLCSRGDSGPCPKEANGTMFEKQGRPLQSQKQRSRVPHSGTGTGVPKVAEGPSRKAPKVPVFTKRHSGVPESGRWPGVRKAAENPAPRRGRPRSPQKGIGPRSKATAFPKRRGALPESGGGRVVSKVA